MRLKGDVLPRMDGVMRRGWAGCIRYSVYLHNKILDRGNLRVVLA